ncbi:MAG: hypothetical protein ACQCN6_07305 [Candidatus Bathyarchaeia archaeon]
MCPITASMHEAAVYKSIPKTQFYPQQTLHAIAPTTATLTATLRADANNLSSEIHGNSQGSRVDATAGYVSFNVAPDARATMERLR